MIVFIHIYIFGYSLTIYLHINIVFYLSYFYLSMVCYYIMHCVLRERVMFTQNIVLSGIIQLLTRNAFCLNRLSCVETNLILYINRTDTVIIILILSSQNQLNQFCLYRIRLNRIHFGTQNAYVNRMHYVEIEWILPWYSRNPLEMRTSCCTPQSISW